MPSSFRVELVGSANKSRETFLLLVATVDADADAATAAAAPAAVTLDAVSVDGGPNTFFGVLHGEGHPFEYLLDGKRKEKKRRKK